VFTGIIEDLGEIRGVAALELGKRLTIATSIPVGEISLGESITIDGACMTVTSRGGAEFEVEVSAESLRRTTLGELGVGDRVNLERSLRMTDRLGGHLVSGHIDGTGIIDEIRNEGESAIFRFRVPRELTALLVEKGSVAVDGISLTCFACTEETFEVAVIPHTAAVTTLGTKNAGDRVNVENDLLAKYVARLVRPLLESYGPTTSGG